MATVVVVGVSCCLVSRPSSTDSLFLSLLRNTIPFSDDDGERESWFLEQDYQDEKLFKKANKKERFDGRRLK